MNPDIKSAILAAYEDWAAGDLRAQTHVAGQRLIELFTLATELWGDDMLAAFRRGVARMQTGGQ